MTTQTPRMAAWQLSAFERVGALSVVLSLLAATPAPASPDAPGLFALSEIKREEVPAPESGAPADGAGETEPAEGVPLPDPILRLPLPETPDTPDSEEPEQTIEETVPHRPGVDEPVPEIVYDLQTLPEPVRRMHELIREACRTGDLEKLRPLIGTGAGGTQLSLGDAEGDPIAFLRELSGDAGGQEILAILLEVLDAGFVHLDAGTPEEMYVWPYFFAVPLDSLTAPQRVELFKIVTAGDYEDMKTYGTYNFYRVGISPEGQWLFFIAGD